MQLVEQMVIKGKGNGEKTEVFQKVNDAIFCKSCGKQYNGSEIVKDQACPICGYSDFLKGDIAETLAGYISLSKKTDKDGKISLKKYFTERTKRKATMNVKRLAIWLLIGDKLMRAGDKEMEEIVNKTMWKRW